MFAEFREKYRRLILSLVFIWPLLTALIAERVAGETCFHTGQAGGFILATAVIYLLFFILIFTTRSGYFSMVIMTVFLVFIAGIDCIKVLIRNEHLFPWDIYYVKNASEITGFLRGLQLPASFWSGIVFLLFTLALFPIIPRFHFQSRSRFLGGMIALTLLIPFGNRETVEQLYSAFGMSLLESVNQSENFKQNGFLGATLINFTWSGASRPTGFSAKMMDELITAYEVNESYTEGGKPDVIVVLSESFWDVTKLPGVTFSRDPLAHYRRIAHRHKGGEMVSVSFGGGTARVEYEVLSGTSSMLFPESMPPYPYLEGDYTLAYPWYFKEQGYDTLAIHTSSATFYDRDVSYPKLGFDRFIGSESLCSEPKMRGGYISDQTLVKEMIAELDKEREEPLFLFGITMEGHGMYAKKYAQKDLKVKVNAPMLSMAEREALENYATAAYYADVAIGELYRYVQEREKPTIMLVFGDHLPALFTGNTTYVKTGLIHSPNESEWSYEETMAMHKTPYLVFDNYRQIPPKQESEARAAYFLMADLIEDYELPRHALVRFLLDAGKATGEYSAGLYNFPEEEKEMIFLYDSAFRAVAYSFITGIGAEKLTALAE